MRIVVASEEAIDRLAGSLRRWVREHQHGLLVSIEPHKPPRTRAQNAKIHVLISEFAIAIGEESDLLKAVLKDRFWPTTIVRLKGEEIAVAKSTSDLTREEASLVIERILQIASEHGVMLAAD